MPQKPVPVWADKADLQGLLLSKAASYLHVSLVNTLLGVGGCLQSWRRAMAQEAAAGGGGREAHHACPSVCARVARVKPIKFLHLSFLKVFYFPIQERPRAERRSGYVKRFRLGWFPSIHRVQSSKYIEDYNCSAIFLLVFILLCLRLLVK